ncbi:hypothetical protein ACIA5E_18105 [Nocardia asteroides]|uniref:hypothetical protein n=1 Tax=Nocardia asteroides TaxID=1824 RepID=UPI0037AC2A45
MSGFGGIDGGIGDRLGAVEGLEIGGSQGPSVNPGDEVLLVVAVGDQAGVDVGADVSAVEQFELLLRGVIAGSGLKVGTGGPSGSAFDRRGQFTGCMHHGRTSPQEIGECGGNPRRVLQDQNYDSDEGQYVAGGHARQRRGRVVRSHPVPPSRGNRLTATLAHVYSPNETERRHVFGVHTQHEQLADRGRNDAAGILKSLAAQLIPMRQRLRQCGASLAVMRALISGGRDDGGSRIADMPLTSPVTGKPEPYGSAADLPSFGELARQVEALRPVTRVVLRSQRARIKQIQHDLDRLIAIVDGFYERLGRRHWIFHDLLNVDKIEKILAETTSAAEAEGQLIALYRDRETLSWWIARLCAHPTMALRQRQIQRAYDHYFADQFDSAVLQLIAVMDGFVNDVEPDVRRGLAARAPEDMTAWDSAVGHHLGLNNAMTTFTKTIKKRIDEEVFELYRHGIMHGSVVEFDNIVVATKAWSMLFAVADWARATQKAAQPEPTRASWGSVWSRLKHDGARYRYRDRFLASQLSAGDAGFGSHPVTAAAGAFLDAWQHQRWGLVVNFAPPASSLNRPKPPAVEAKKIFAGVVLTSFTITTVECDCPWGAQVSSTAHIDGAEREIRFRMVLYTPTGELGLPDEPDAMWLMAQWALPQIADIEPAAGR